VIHVRGTNKRQWRFRDICLSPNTVALSYYTETQDWWVKLKHLPPSAFSSSQLTVIEKHNKTERAGDSAVLGCYHPICPRGQK
jgi:hypothetical protein